MPSDPTELLLPPHMRYPGAWELSSPDLDPREAVAHADWIRADDERLESFRNAIFRHQLGMISVVAAVALDPETGERSKMLVENYYFDGLEGTGDLHNHLRSGTGSVVGASRDQSMLRQEYYLPVMANAHGIPGLETTERHLVVSAIEQPESPDGAASYHPHIVGPVVLHKLGESTLRGLGSHRYSTVFVHEITYKGPMSVSYLTKGPLEDPALTSPDGLAVQGFSQDQIADVIDFKQHLERRLPEGSLCGVSPIYMEEVPDSDNELAQTMQSDSGEQLTDGERDEFMEMIFDGYDDIARWAGRLAA